MTTLATIDSTMQLDPDALPAGELGTHAPFAYRLAVPIADPEDPDTIPRMVTHPTTTTYTSCDSNEWCACLYTND